MSAFTLTNVRTKEDKKSMLRWVRAEYCNLVKQEAPSPRDDSEVTAALRYRRRARDEFFARNQKHGEHEKVETDEPRTHYSASEFRNLSYIAFMRSKGFEDAPEENRPLL